MNIKELRIGNYVSKYNFNFELYEIRKIFNIDIDDECVSLQSTNYFVDLDKIIHLDNDKRKNDIIITNPVHISDIEPLELNAIVSKYFDIEKNNKIKLSKNQKFVDVEFKNDHKHYKVNFLHELQNIFEDRGSTLKLEFK